MDSNNSHSEDFHFVVSKLRSGGGIGITRLISSMKKEGLIPKF